MHFPTSFDTTIDQKKPTPSPLNPSNSTPRTLKTSNLNIFPSLNPMGAFYKQRNTTVSLSARQGHSDLNDPDPSKKIKSNNGYDLCTKENKMKEYDESSIDKDGFRVPRLPKNYKSKHKGRSKAFWEDKLSTYDESLTHITEEGKRVSIDIMKDLKEARSSFMGQKQNKKKIQDTPQISKKKETNRERKTRLKASRQSTKPKMQENAPKEHFENFNPNYYPDFFSSLYYDQIHLDYYSGLLKQNIELLSYACHHHSARISQSCHDFIKFKMKSDYFDIVQADTDEDEDNNIKEESLKEEISC